MVRFDEIFRYATVKTIRGIINNPDVKIPPSATAADINRMCTLLRVPSATYFCLQYFFTCCLNQLTNSFGINSFIFYLLVTLFY